MAWNTKELPTAQFRFQVAVSNSFQQVKLEYSTTEEQCSQQDKHGSLPDLLSYVFCNLACEEIWDACLVLALLM